MRKRKQYKKSGIRITRVVNHENGMGIMIMLLIGEIMVRK